jgi:hypothetical protein
VLDRLRAFFSSRIDVSDALAPLDLEARALDAALRLGLPLLRLRGVREWVLALGWLAMD